jgi:hypothetical protein
MRMDGMARDLFARGRVTMHTVVSDAMQPAARA